MKTTMLLLITLLLVACSPFPSPVPEIEGGIAAPVSVTVKQQNPENEEQGEKAQNIVRIQSFSFVPQSIIIQEGETVKWINEDRSEHNIKFLGAPPSEILSYGQSYQMTFFTAGEYPYSSGIHAKVQGTVMVR